MTKAPLDELQQIAWARADMMARGHHALRVLMGPETRKRLMPHLEADFRTRSLRVLDMPVDVMTDMEGFAVVRGGHAVAPV